MPDNKDTTGSGSADSGASPEKLSKLSWEEREAATEERLGPPVDISESISAAPEVDGANFTRLTEATDRLKKSTTANAGDVADATTSNSALNELNILAGSAGKMTGKTQFSPAGGDEEEVIPGLREMWNSGLENSEDGAAGFPVWSYGSGLTPYDMEPIGDDVVDASIAARVAELRAISEIIGADGEALGAAAAEHYTFTETPALIEKAQQAITSLASSFNDTYTGQQEWFNDLISERTRTFDLLSELGSATEIGQLTSGMSAAQETANSVIDAVNLSSASYIEQRYRAIEQKHKSESMWERLKMSFGASANAYSGSFRDGLSGPQPIEPRYGYIPALDSAIETVDGTATKLSSVATNELVGQMRELVGAPGATHGGNDLGSAQTKANDTPGGVGGGGSRGGGGGGGLRRGGMPGGGSSTGGSSRRKSGSSDDKVRDVADRLADLFAEAGGGAAGAAAVADAASAQGLTAAQLAAAGMSPEMLAAMGMGSPVFNPSAMQGGLPLDQRLAGLGNTHLTNAGDLGGLRGALGSDVGSGGVVGGVGRPFSPESRATDSMLTPAPAPSVGDPVRRTALGADMRPLDQTGSGRMSPEAVPPTRQNMTDANGNPKQVETVIEIGGQEHPITIDDPRLLEMMNIVSAEGSADSPMEILEAAKRAGVELASYGDYIGNPLDAKPGDVVISGKGNGFYMGDGRVLMETGEIKPISEVLELRPPESGIFRLALPELPDGDADGHKDWDTGEEKTEDKGPSAGGFAPSTPAPSTGDSSFDPFANGGGTPPPTTDAPMDAPVVPDTDSPEAGGTSPTTPTNVPTGTVEAPRPAADLPVSDAPITMGSSSSATVTTESAPVPDTHTSASGSLSAEAVGMVEVEYEGRPLGGEPVRY